MKLSEVFERLNNGEIIECKQFHDKVWKIFNTSSAIRVDDLIENYYFRVQPYPHKIEYDVTEKEHEILEYCKDHTDKMWAATIVGIILDCEFMDAPIEIKRYFNERS